MPKFYNSLTGEIVDYPAEAAALFDVLKPVPSERAKAAKEASALEDTQPLAEVDKPKPAETKTPAKKNGEVENAK